MKHRSRAEKTGLPPGSLVHVGERQVDEIALSLIDYNPERINTRELATVAEASACLRSDSLSWLNIVGLHNTRLLEEIGATFGIHPLVLEDILNTDQRPKVEVFDDFLFVVVKMMRPPSEGSDEIDVEQVSMIVSERFLITFQERPGDVFDSVRERLNAGKGRLRTAGADYLAHTLLDGIVDHYFLVLDHLAGQMDSIEETVLEQKDPQVSHRIHRLKHDLILVRKAVWPLRDMIGILLRDEPPPIKEDTLPFLRDLYEHTVHVVDTLDTYREMVSGLLEIHFSLVNYRMSEVMKVLTVIATIFIPLTFVAGIYGMNFAHMPELEWQWAYPAVLAVMLGIAGGLLAYFRVKRWI